MNLRQTLMLTAMFSLAPVTMVFAQEQPTPSSTSPSSASSPAQRDATSTPATEASPTDNTQGTSPSAASTPHQQQSTSGNTRTASKQLMNDCITKQQAENSGMSKADAKKTCKAQMKGPG